MGGVWSTTDGGVSFFNHNTNDLSITQFYYGSVHSKGGDRALGGAQDNGTALWLGTNGWAFVGYGDGSDNAFSPLDPDNNAVVSWQNVQIWRYTHASGPNASFSSAYCGGCSNGPLGPNATFSW